MKLPSGITFEQTLLGSGNGATARGLENGQPVIVKSPEAAIGLFGGGLFEDDEPQESAIVQKFEFEKERELQAAEKSQYFIKGRIEKEDTEVFWIRPYIHRSLHEKVAFKETPDSEELLGICRAIVRALAELNTIDHSGHGNLSLGNVLIGGKDSCDLKLVDLFRAHRDNGRADKRALGLIIYQLVNGEFVELADKIAAVPDDQDWKILGATEQMWRDLCSELLNPYGKYADADWDQVDQTLKKIEAANSKRKKLKVTFVVSAFLMFGAVAFLVWKLKFQEEEIVVDLNTIQGQWIELLDNYFSWGGNYLKSKSDFEETSDSKNFVKRFYDDKKARLPMKIIGRVTGQGARMQTAPDQVYEDARRIDVLLLDNSKQQQIVLAHRFLMDLRAEIENWEVLEELSEVNQSFTDSGFEFGADETRRLLDSISFEDGSLTVSRLYALKTSADGLGELQSLYTRFKAQVADLNKTESVFLPRYAKYLNQQLANPAEDPVAHLRSLVESSAAAFSYWETEKSGIARDLFFKSERDFISRPSFTVNEKSAIKWKGLVSDFRLIEIPELGSGQNEFLSSRDNIQNLNDQINELQEPDLEPATFDQEFEQLFEVFQDDVDMPLIQANRVLIEAAVSENLAELKSLVESAEDRWAEVNPDIGERLQQLAIMPDGFAPALASAWQAYLDGEVNVRTEDSFADPREFIMFQREYFVKRKNFEYFQESQLSQLLPEFSEETIGALRQEIVPALQTTKRAYYDELVYEWVDQINPILLNAEDPLAIHSLTDVFLQRMRDYESQLLDYAKLLGDTLNDFDDWELPKEGVEDRWSVLNEGGLRKKWNQSEAFAPFSGQVKAYFNLSQISTMESVLAFILDEKKPPFARSLGLDEIAGSKILSPAELVQISEIIPKLYEQVPEAEVDGFEATLKSLWMEAFEADKLDKESRGVIFSCHDAMSIRAIDLSGRIRFVFEIYSALAELKRNESSYLENPELLKEFISNFASLPEDANEPELSGIIDELEAVDLAEAKETFENAPFLKKGWKIESESEEQLVLAWQDHRLVFHLVEDEEDDFFLAEAESSIELFNDWMTANRLWVKSAESLPREWEVFISQAYSAIDDYRSGMKLWSIARRGLKRDGINLSLKLFEVDTVVSDEYKQIEPELFPESLIDEKLPMQHLGAKLASFFADSMGMLLPTPSQWQLVVENYPADKAFFWQSRMNTDLSKELASEIRSGSYYVERKIEESGYGADRPVVLANVNEYSDFKFKHLAGNIAEYLYDPEAGVYYVAGGSAFSATLSTWKDEHLVPKRNELTAFSDVGVRLALIAPEQSAYMQYTNIIDGALN